MSAIKEILFRRQEQANCGGAGDLDLEAAAKALGGEVVGDRRIACPSPGRPPGDRSCMVVINQRGAPWVYAYAGTWAAVKAKVFSALEYLPPQAADSEKVARVWEETIPAAGTLVEIYLRCRGITLPVPECLRFHPDLAFYSFTSCRRSTAPAMVAARTSVRGDGAAIHRTWLRRDGRGKAEIESPKRMLGSATGAAIRLAPAAAEMAVGEGIETSLSFMQASGLATWAAGSAPALATLELPGEVRSVAIAVDGDEPGRRAANTAAARWTAEGRIVRIYPAPTGRDFNDLLREARDGR